MAGYICPLRMYPRKIDNDGMLWEKREERRKVKKKERKKERRKEEEILKWKVVFILCLRLNGAKC